MEGIRVTRQNVRPKGLYGIDAPHLLPVLALLFIANLAQGVMSGKLWPILGAIVILVVLVLDSTHPNTWQIPSVEQIT